MSASLYNACVPATFGTPYAFGTDMISLETTLVTNYNISSSPRFRFTQPLSVAHNLTFCNITVSYTHPGENDVVVVEAWLPVNNWNGRLQAVGGGEWAAGRITLSYSGMNGSIADGYATVTTDAGIGTAMEAAPWALLSPGNVNLYSLKDFGSVSLNDQASAQENTLHNPASPSFFCPVQDLLAHNIQAIISKSLIKSFYGRAPEFSYWNGCSQGGRQGMMLAQRYPTAYDGIAAGAPAIYFAQLLASIHWPHQYMNMLGDYPHGCELDAISAAAVSACDGLDGVIDGIIAEVDACLATFDPFQLIGQAVKSCEQAGDNAVKISRTAAAVMNATWNGIVTAEGKWVWHGLNPGADVTTNDPRSLGMSTVAATNCTDGVCVGKPNLLSVVWLQLFLAKDPDFDISSITHEEFDRFVHASIQEYAYFINTDDADLSAFRNAGGKLISFHGLTVLIKLE